MSEKHTPCANLRTIDCNNFVTKRGNILCDSCITNRTNRTNDSQNLRCQIKTLESKYTNMDKRYNQIIEDYEKIIKELREENSSLLEDLKTQKNNYSTTIKETINNLGVLHDMEIKNLRQNHEDIIFNMKKKIEISDLRLNEYKLIIEDYKNNQKTRDSTTITHGEELKIESNDKKEDQLRKKMREEIREEIRTEVLDEITKRNTMMNTKKTQASILREKTIKARKRK